MKPRLPVPFGPWRLPSHELADLLRPRRIHVGLGAPKTGDTADWQARADARGGLDGLLQSAIAGINSMPPKGMCADCTDDELKEAIHKMSGL